MKKKNSARDNVNLFFSAFLIIAYIVCGFFFVSFTSQQANPILKNTLTALILVIFGLLVFYATRVGEGAVVKRFSLVTLIVLVLPTLFIVLAYIIPVFPLHNEFVSNDVMAYMAGAALGYGIPYTFISGFELADDEDKNQEEDEEVALEFEVVKGGVEEDLIDAQDDEEVENESDQTEDAEEEEIVVEGTAIIDDVEAYVAEQQESDLETEVEE